MSKTEETFDKDYTLFVQALNERGFSEGMNTMLPRTPGTHYSWKLESFSRAKFTVWVYVEQGYDHDVRVHIYETGDTPEQLQFKWAERNVALKAIDEHVDFSKELEKLGEELESKRFVQGPSKENSIGGKLVSWEYIGSSKARVQFSVAVDVNMTSHTIDVYVCTKSDQEVRSYEWESRHGVLIKIESAIRELKEDDYCFDMERENEVTLSGVERTYSNGVHIVHNDVGLGCHASIPDGIHVMLRNFRESGDSEKTALENYIKLLQERRDEWNKAIDDAVSRAYAVIAAIKEEKVK